MDESHASQRDSDDISEAPIDVLVELLQGAEGVYGAQLTGEGFGGAVVFLAEKSRGRQIAERILPFYEAHRLNGGHYRPSIVAPTE